MYVSNIIPTFNRKEVLQEHLEALVDQTLPRAQFEVIVVSDGSDDGTDEMMAWIAEYVPYTLQYIRNERNGWGGSRARNTGIRAAHGDIIVMTDDDTIPVTRDYLSIYARAVRPGVAVLGFCPWTDRLVWGDHHNYYSYFLPLNAGVWKDDLMRVGLFAEDLNVYGFEDVELGLRLHLDGTLFVYCRAARVESRHLVPYNQHPMAQIEKMRSQRAAWEWFEQRYAEAGLDWSSFWREDGRHNEQWAHIGEPLRR